MLRGFELGKIRLGLVGQLGEARKQGSGFLEPSGDILIDRLIDADGKVLLEPGDARGLPADPPRRGLRERRGDRHCGASPTKRARARRPERSR